MRGKLVLLIVAAMVAIGTLQIGSVSAHGSHVEYTVEPQPGINVVQHGRSGLVEVEVTHCLIAEEPFTFTMLISSSRSGHSDLSVRKNSSVDISRWFSLEPGSVDLPSDGTEVVVEITPPVGTELDQRAVARIQEVGDPPSPGGHHGVKVRVSCVKQPTPTPTPEATPTPSSTPTPTITPVIGSSWSATPVPTPPPTGLVPPEEETPVEEPTPIPEMPKAFPDSGGVPTEQKDSPWRYLLIGGATLALTGGYLVLRHWRGVR